ncbi:tetraspanin-16 [Trichosurus vulpecula]|uniref:tetraspanin-16 n=1 Tax=Trichosurus vulpecula TaxID=9337 RepID=UPI00186B2D9C|nr:tetraspanin-16 [Trichosurus vulpecula]
MALFALLKILIFLFNSIIFFGGLGLLAIGLCLKIDGSSFTDFLGATVSPFTQLVVIRYLCIIIGSILMFLGILGCWGAIRENKSLLLLFFIIILIVFLIKMASAMIILVFSSIANALFTHIDSWAVGTLRESYGKEENITKMWNTTMMELNCCGFHNYTDFSGSKYQNLSGGHYPAFCCKENLPCRESGIANDKEGCLHKLKESLENNGKLIGGVGLGILVFEVAAMVVSMILFFKIDDISYD